VLPSTTECIGAVGTSFLLYSALFRILCSLYQFVIQLLHISMAASAILTEKTVHFDRT